MPAEIKPTKEAEDVATWICAYLQIASGGAAWDQIGIEVQSGLDQHALMLVRQNERLVNALRLAARAIPPNEPHRKAALDEAHKVLWELRGDT